MTKQKFLLLFIAFFSYPIVLKTEAKNLIWNFPPLQIEILENATLFDGSDFNLPISIDRAKKLFGCPRKVDRKNEYAIRRKFRRYDIVANSYEHEDKIEQIVIYFNHHWFYFDPSKIRCDSNVTVKIFGQIIDKNSTYDGLLKNPVLSSVLRENGPNSLVVNRNGIGLPVRLMFSYDGTIEAIEMS